MDFHTQYQVSQNFSPLTYVCWDGDFKKVKELHKAGADLNALDPSGSTALHRAVAGARNDITSYLLAHGARVNARNAQGSTALHLVTSVKLARELMESGATLGCKNYFGASPFDYAIKLRQWDLVSYYLSLDDCDVCFDYHVAENLLSHYSDGDHGLTLTGCRCLSSAGLNVILRCLLHLNDPTIQKLDFTDVSVGMNGVGVLVNRLGDLSQVQQLSVRLESVEAVNELRKFCKEKQIKLILDPCFPSLKSISLQYVKHHADKYEHRKKVLPTDLIELLCNHCI